MKHRFKKVMSFIVTSMLVMPVFFQKAPVYADNTNDKVQKIIFKWKEQGKQNGYYNPDDKTKEKRISYVIEFKGVGADGKTKEKIIKDDTYIGKIGEESQREVRLNQLLSNENKVYSNCEIKNIYVPSSDQNKIYTSTFRKVGDDIEVTFHQTMNLQVQSKIADKAIVLEEDKQNMIIRYTVTKNNDANPLKNKGAIITRMLTFKVGEDNVANGPVFKEAVDSNILDPFTPDNNGKTHFNLKVEFYGKQKEELKEKYDLTLKGNDLSGWELELTSKIEKATKIVKTEQDFQTIYEDDPHHEQGYTKVKTKGVKGETLTETPYYYILHNGQEKVIKELTAEATVKKIAPIDQVVIRGTKGLNHKPNLVVKDKTIEVGEQVELKSLIERADDIEDGPKLDDMVVIDKGQFNNQKAGKYEIKYTLTDKGGLSVSKKAIITVNAKRGVIQTPPTLVLKDVSITKGTALQAKQFIESAKDQAGNDLKDQVRLIDKGNFDSNKVGKYVLTFKVTDNIGMSTIKKVNVSVVEKTEDLNNNNNNNNNQPPVETKTPSTKDTSLISSFLVMISLSALAILGYRSKRKLEN